MAVPEIVPPKTTGSVTIDFLPPEDLSEIVRTIELVYSGKNQVSLEVRAKPRSELSCLPRKIDVGQVQGLSGKSNAFEILNFSGRPWTELTITPSVDWIECKSSITSADSLVRRFGNASPVEGYNVDLSIRPPSNKLGNYAEGVTVAAKSESGEEVSKVEVLGYRSPSRVGNANGTVVFIRGGPGWRTGHRI